MATLVLSAVGTLIGGPIGGTIGALIGRQVDARIIGSPTREGPRLTELAVSTSSYGQAVPQVHGTMRIGGSIIWATELVESRSTSGGKGQPKTTSYSYSTSFAVALSSRPIERVGRIWADGNLLRGAAGDLKAAGTLRIHAGHGDQPPDPLIASAESGACPAFRGLAYAVFEDLDLTDFGNRIPALSFEVIADSGEVALAELLATQHTQPLSLPGLAGLALQGGSLADSLAVIDTVYPLACDASEARLRFRDPERITDPIALPESVAGRDEGDFGGPVGSSRARQPQSDEGPRALRYYDPARDYQPGLQRAVGPTPASGQAVIEFPGVLAAGQAKALAEAASLRVRWQRQQMAWRMAELDPAIVPGSVVQLPGEAGEWLVSGWEWRERGVELELLRRRPTSARTGGGAAGSTLPPVDRSYGPSLLDYFELPYDGTGNPAQRRMWLAAGTTGAPRGAAIFAVAGGVLTPLTTIARADALLGQLTAPLAPSPALRLEWQATLTLALADTEAELPEASPEALLGGTNRLLVGAEVVQFARAEPLDGGAWRLAGILRGRGGTEIAAQLGHAAGTRVVILDDRLVPVVPEPGQIAPPPVVAAIGLGDAEPVLAGLRNPQASVTPLGPVHPQAWTPPGGGRGWRWIRRSRGIWSWPEGVDVPLVEPSESWLVGAGPVAAPLRSWQVGTAQLVLSTGELDELLALAGGQPLWVRQIGGFALSPPLLLEHLP